MTNKEKFREVFGYDLCYCGSPEHKGLLYMIKVPEPTDKRAVPVFEDKFEAKWWLEHEYKGSDTVVHCNVKENAELIAKIMNADAEGEMVSVNEVMEVLR